MTLTYISHRGVLLKVDAKDLLLLSIARRGVIRRVSGAVRGL